MKNFKDKIESKYTPKRTKLHHFKKNSHGGMPPNPPSKAHGFATCKFPNLKKKICPPPPKSWLRPCYVHNNYMHISAEKNLFLKIYL